MNDFSSLTSYGTEISVSEAPSSPVEFDAGIAAAFQTVLNAMRSFDLSSADTETVSAFQTVLDAITSFSPTLVAGSTDPAPVAAPTATAASATPSAPVIVSPTPGLGPALPAVLPVVPPALVAAGLRTSGPYVVGGVYIVIPPQHLAAIPDPPVAEGEDPPLWWCISKGKFVGVVLSQGLALAATVGVSGGRMKSFKTQILALNAFNEFLDFHQVTFLICISVRSNTDVPVPFFFQLPLSIHVLGLRTLADAISTRVNRRFRSALPTARTHTNIRKVIDSSQFNTSQPRPLVFCGALLLGISPANRIYGLQSPSPFGDQCPCVLFLYPGPSLSSSARSDNGEQHSRRIRR
ncbi:hypothetical protein R3P38DRAFT_3347622 [Favolaschia claudopus]|uniref:Uncharacterized protein n=1 Tax=Favolaschia claudopus TaxID=2862362 RepID=A0AAW0CWI5_9AGAR